MLIISNNIYIYIGVLITSNKEYFLLAAGSARCHINGIVKDKLWVTCPNLGVMQCIGLWQPQVIDRKFIENLKPGNIH